MLDYNSIINRFYPEDSELHRILFFHSRAVAQKALSIIDSKRLPLDREFVEEASMLHDIGIFYCDAPTIFCTGSEPYIRHGILGAELLRELALPRHALVCERHTGSGLSRMEIIKNNLPLPHRDMLPLSTEEKLICYADKFFSKSRQLNEEKPIDKIFSQMETHGPETYQRFLELHKMFS